MEKLKNITFSTLQVSKLAGKAFIKGDWHPLDSATATIAAPVNLYISITRSKGNWTYASKKTGVQLVCDLTPSDIGILMMGFAYLNGYPDAQKMLWYYFTGNGNDLEVDTELVFKEDDKLKTFVLSSIVSQIAKGHKDGKINVRQENYGNQNWRNAFGSINVHWKLVNKRLELWIQDKYEWHPDELRISQCVHQAMNRAKEYGAKAFNYHGTKLYINLPASNSVVPNRLN